MFYVVYLRLVPISMPFLRQILVQPRKGATSFRITKHNWHKTQINQAYELC